MNEVAAIVVTYNRKECLLNCLEAIRRQTLPPDIIYIIDNHSTDGTSDLLYDNYYIADRNPQFAGDDYIAESRITSLFDDRTIRIQYIYKSEIFLDTIELKAIISNKKKKKQNRVF